MRPAIRPAARRSRFRSKLAPLAHGEVAALTMATTPLKLPDLAFEDADGKPKKLSDWRGRTVLVNLWATWCVPCRKEMPALDSLQAKLGGPDFEVVAVNIDTRDPEKPKNFLKDANLTRLGYFTDEKAKVFQDLKSIGRALGMPTSVLVDGQGCEIATIAGPADWASDDAVKLISAAIKPARGRALGSRPKYRDCRQRRRQDWPSMARPDAQKRLNRGFLRIDVRLHDRSRDLRLRVPGLKRQELPLTKLISIRNTPTRGMHTATAINKFLPARYRPAIMPRWP